MPRAHDDPWPAGQNDTLFDLSDGTNNNRVFLYWDDGGETWNLYINGAVIITSDPQTFEAGDWLLIGFDVDFANDEYRLWVNGYVIGSATNLLAAPAGLTQWCIGADYSQSSQADFVIAEMLLLNRVMEDHEQSICIKGACRLLT